MPDLCSVQADVGQGGVRRPHRGQEPPQGDDGKLQSTSNRLFACGFQGFLTDCLCFQNGVPRDNPMHRLTERMHYEATQRQATQMRLNSHAARVDSAILDTGAAGAGAAGAAAGAAGAVDNDWRWRLRKQAERDLLKRRELEKQIEEKDVEVIQHIRKERELSSNLAHYKDTRDECREQAKEITKLTDEIQALKLQQGRATDEAKTQRDALSSELSAMRLVSEQESREVSRLRADVADKDRTITEQIQWRATAERCLDEAKTALIHKDQEQQKAAAAAVRNISRSGGESAAKMMQIKHELGQAQQAMVSRNAELARALRQRDSEIMKREKMQENLDQLKRDRSKLDRLVPSPGSICHANPSTRTPDSGSIDDTLIARSR